MSNKSFASRPEKTLNSLMDRTDDSDAFNRSQMTSRSPELSCIVCDDPIKGMPSTSCPKCRRPIHNDCRESGAKDDFCPGCKVRPKPSSSSGSRTLRLDNCYRCQKQVRRSDCEQVKKSDGTLVNVCKLCIESIRKQKEKPASVSSQNVIEKQSAQRSTNKGSTHESPQKLPTEMIPIVVDATIHATNDTREVPNVVDLSSQKTMPESRPPATIVAPNGLDEIKVPEKTKSLSSKSSSKNSLMRKKLEEEQAELKRAVEMCNKKLFELEQAQQDLKSRSGSSRKSGVSLSDTEILNKTSEWIDKSTRVEPQKVTFSNQTQRESPRPIATLTRENVRASTPAPWFEARTFEQFSTSLREPSSQQRSTWDRSFCRLTKDQIYSRQVIPKELPPFSGDPQEWPIFISSFAISTQRCGYSDEENVLRLRQALRGAALETVKTQLRFPEMLVETLNTLRIKYGRPDQILDSVMERIHQTPPLQTDNLGQLIDFSLIVRDLYATIKASKMEEHLQNPMLLRELVGKLSGSLQMQWGRFKRTAGSEDVCTFGQWLFDLADIASELPGSRTIPSKRESSRAQAKKASGHVYAIEEKPKFKQPSQCPVCSKQHDTPSCPTFLVKSPDDRWKLVLELSLCGKCLRKHNFRFCRERRKCTIDGCKQTHHFLIHGHSFDAIPLQTVSENNPVEKPTNSRTSEGSFTHGISTSEVLFRIVPVRLYGRGDRYVTIFAFLDEGSSVTLLDQEIAEVLDLDGPHEDLCLKWTGDTTRMETNSRRVAFQISGDTPNSKQYTISDVRTVRDLKLQQQSFDVTEFSKKTDCLRNAPVSGYNNVTPRMLIGLAHWSLALPTFIREDSKTGLIVTRSKLGWAVSGHIGRSKITEAFHAHVCECTHDEDLHRSIKEFFSLEYFGVRSSNMVHESKEDERAKRLLQNSMQKVDGRYELALLWKYDNIQLPDSRQMAMRRMLCLEKKLSRDEILYESLREQMAEYLRKGYARRLSKAEENIRGPRTWYLPLFAVTNPNKPGKIRMVWDAAAKVNNTCLNDHLLSGPDYLSPLPDVLRRFRQFKFAVTGDIREMFHQIRIRQEDQDSQRFLWRESSACEVETFVMCVMTFGATCSPSAAQFVKNSHAQTYQNKFPRAVKAIVHNHYVDDYVDSFPTIDEAVHITKDVMEIHSTAGFELRNFASNASEVLKATGTLTTTAIKNLDNGETQNTKILGMFWDVQEDMLVFKLHIHRINPDLLSGFRRPTKREVLRILMMIFDPLGLIAHILVLAKILLQDIWRTKVGWDDPIKTDQMNRWVIWTKLLKKLDQVQIPRCYHYALSNSKQKALDLHIFVDASDSAYAAIAYFRVELDFNMVKCVLVGAKTKMAPQKPLSIPRMELQAAVLGTRLAESIAKAHDLQIRKRVFWSDSTTVLGWLNSDARKYKPFVAFRVGEILEASEINEWRYVPTKLNVADVATKWRSDFDNETSYRWFHGPEYLLHNESSWPNKIPITIEKSDEELRKVHVQHITLVVSNNPSPSNVSTWKVLVRAQAFTTRAINWFMLRVRNVGNKETLGSFTALELEDAKNTLMKIPQYERYSEEIQCINNEEDLPKKSPLLSLSPILDSDGLLRMKGRISDLKVQAIYPIILPKDHRITYLIVKNMHDKYHHHNHETVINEIRQIYWIARLRVVAKQVRKDCFTCRRYSAKPLQPLEADLPKMRLAAGSSPFAYTGLDYFGPIEVVVGRRREKRWGALFTCLTMRAIHVEVAHTLTANSAIMCVRRFIARRGIPSEIWSDNGTNFRKASLDLKNALLEFSPEEVAESFDNIRWKFIPPSAPNMGGAWERLVRSVKNSLSYVLPNLKFNDEQLLSALAEVENIVNSRPLTYVPVERDAPEALTPNHLLLGNSNGSKSPGIFSDEDCAVRRQWIVTQRIAEAFWKRWLLEYLPTITRRTKWCKPCTPIKVGDIGLLWDTTLRNSWKMGKVVEVTPGANNQVREIVVKTSTGLIRRPASKFAVLDVLPCQAAEGETQ